MHSYANGIAASGTTPASPSTEGTTDGPKVPKDEDVEMSDAALSKADDDEKGESKDTSDGEGKVEGASVGSKGKEKETDAPDAPPVEVIDVDELDTKTPIQATATQAPPVPTPLAYGPFNIDVSFEASKLPLDVAIFNSARAAGGDEKIRKYLQAVLVIGGTALVPGMAHALESRYVPCHHLP